MINGSHDICNRCGDVLTPQDIVKTGVWKDISLCNRCRLEWVNESIAIENGEPYAQKYVKHQSKLKERTQNIYSGIQVSAQPIEPKYPQEFNEEFKERIRDRFNRQCFLCNDPEEVNGKRLEVHHIDYDKKNMDEANFIPCCRKCHGKTNGNREYWERTIKEKLRRSAHVI